MNPRTFCREPGYELTICVTYSFDPLFFERVLLHDLWAGGSSEILVIADEGQAVGSVTQAIGQLSHLGRRYQLATVPGIGAQHAKMILRIGNDGAIVWLGSNNLTAPAWNGGSREVASAWHVQRDDLLGSANLKSILETLLKLSPVAARRTLNRALDREWLGSAPDGVEQLSVLLSGLSETLSSKLEERWQDRTFQRACILTGSTDEGGAMLKWLATTFGVEEVRVALDPKRSAFQPAKLQKLPLSVGVIPLDAYPAPHAKFVWLEGKRGCAAIMGSANCSAAAWLVPAKDGGNIESVIVFDDCKEDEFRNCLDLFAEKPAIPPQDVTGLGTITAGNSRSTVQPDVQLTDLSCNAQIGELRATVTSPITPGMSVEVEISGFRMPLRPGDGDGHIWLGPMPDLVTGGTHFGRLIVQDGPKSILYSELMWLNEEDELQHSVRGRQISGTILNLGRSLSTSNEQQKLLQELAQVASALFSDRAAFPDPVIGPTTISSSTNDQSSSPVNPDELIRTMAELGERDRHLGSTVAPVHGLPLVGVMRVLFPPIDEGSENELSEESDEEKQQRKSEGGNLPTPPIKSVAVPPQRFRKRLVSLLELFLNRLAEPEFARRCTATQLVQAVGFPLAVAIKAHEGGWIDRIVADSWVFKITDLLFRVGLLSNVRERYRSEGRIAVFEKIVGDGRLWVAVAAALRRGQLKNECNGLEYALTLSDVYREPILWSTADPSRIQTLVSRIDRSGTGKTILTGIRKIANVVHKIEGRLASRAVNYSERQINGDHASGDPVWRQGMGFGRTQQAAPIEKGAHLNIYLRKRGKVATVGSTYYINLRIAAQQDPTLARLLDQIAPCWSGHMKKK